MADMTTQEILQGIKDWAAPKVIYDISAAHNNTKYTDLADALGTNGGNIPQEYRKGGITVRYVRSSDNKYVQFFCTADDFTTDVTKWQGVDNNNIKQIINDVNLIITGKSGAYTKVEAKLYAGRRYRITSSNLQESVYFKDVNNNTVLYIQNNYDKEVVFYKDIISIGNII
jgi:hypothetical protein